jgi:hypothetical protein
MVCTPRRCGRVKGYEDSKAIRLFRKIYGKTSVLAQKKSNDSARAAGCSGSAVMRDDCFVCLVNTGCRLAFYLALLTGLAFCLMIGIICNGQGKYLIAAWITAACMIAGPWISILFDPSVLSGDMIPIVYVGLSIQLSAILLSERATLFISAVQLAGVLAALLLSSSLSCQTGRACLRSLCLPRQSGFHPDIPTGNKSNRSIVNTSSY